ncbi:MAG: protein phosphatase 2C domain-containing protein [Candidatus Spechtbacterales bacterium]
MKLFFETDSYFHIGHQHLNSGKPCQDYATSATYNDAAFAIVSDGCSSGGKTDVGARILALATASAICEHWTTVRTVREDTVPLEISIRQRLTMAGTRKTLGLSRQDMLATCLYQYLTPCGGFVHLQGDGVFAYKKRSGHIYMCRYEWADNKPLYLAYAEDYFAGFIKDHGGDVNAARLAKQYWEYTPDGKFSQLPSEEVTLGEAIHGITIRLSADELRDVSFSAVFSDGVTQIDSLDWKEAVVELLAFKTIEGEFAKRRMIRAIKDAQKNGKGPADDIAYAVVRVILPQGNNMP